MVIALDHFLHGSHLSGCQSCRLASRTAGSIVKLAPNLGTAPAVVARRRQARDPQCHTQRYRPTRSLDRPKQRSFPVAFGKPLVVQVALRYAKHHDQQADDGAEHGHSMTQLLHLGQKLGLDARIIGVRAIKRLKHGPEVARASVKADIEDIRGVFGRHQVMTSGAFRPVIALRSDSARAAALTDASTS